MVILVLLVIVLSAWCFLSVFEVNKPDLVELKKALKDADFEYLLLAKELIDNEIKMRKS